MTAPSAAHGLTAGNAEHDHLHRAAGRTTVTVRWLPLNATAEERQTFEAGFDSMQQGWGGTLDQLDYLAKAK